MKRAAGAADVEEPAAKRPAAGEDAGAATGSSAPAAAADDDFDALLGSVDDVFAELDDGPPKEAPEEAARRNFAERLAHIAEEGFTEADLPDLANELIDQAPKWGHSRRWRSVALLLVYVARAPRGVRAAFASEYMALLGSVLQESVGALEAGEGTARQEAGMLALACLACLRALPIGRATMWEHRLTVGKAFDRLHRWCGKERSALAAELRAPTTALCKRWRRQPRPATQGGSPEEKAFRLKVVEILAQGLMGISGMGSPASPAAPLMSPGRMPPTSTASELEAALFGLHNSVTAEYRQHSRMLRSNLAANAPLRERVLSGEMTPEELVRLDSQALASDALQEQRRVSAEKALRESVIQELVPISRLRTNSDDRLAYDRAMAPPVWVSPVRQNSEEIAAEAGESAAAKAAAPALAPMEPPPTPFRLGEGDHSASAASAVSGIPGSGASGAGSAALAAGVTPEVLATPAPDDEDEEHASLVRFLSARQP
eukprot:TRINITY_DN21864_c0_g2_i1.p1 TRINITY_DN21864_c0_g2~~TRINITY_DN21864_c0_g2_i1.p1  ORF type:complete len:510 (-),score=111.26 TRINITY_DN21864_c0_g2_i1:155-1621(-)